MSNFLLFVLVLLVISPILLYFIQKYNLKYYKIHGRTPIEIESWLKTRSWYATYRAEIFSCLLEEFKSINDRSPEDHEIDTMMEKIESTVRGEFDKSTISGAFSWATTKEGTEVWAKREYSFLKWYFGQYIDFHLFR